MNDVVRTTLWAIGLVLVCSLPVQARDTTSPSAVSVEGILADQLVILTRRTLVSVGDPREDQLVRAGILLDLSTELNPDSADAWQLQSELALRIDDQQRDLQALKQYCRLIPQDDAAQLRLVSHLLKGHHTIQERAKFAKRLVDGRAAKRLPASVRSNLAVMLAESAMETADVAGAAARVQQAVSLDPTNRRATEMAYQLASESRANLLAIGKALLVVIRADPLNSQNRQVLAQLLLATGAYDAAAEQFAVAWATGMQQLDAPVFFRWAWTLSAAGRHDEAMNLISQFEAQVRARQQNAGATTQPTNDMVIPVDLELLRIVIARQAGQQRVSDQVAERLRTHYQMRIEAGDHQAKIDWNWYSLFLDLGPVTEAGIDEVANMLGPEHPASVRFRGWYLIRNGRLDEATDVLGLAADSDPFSAYGLAVATSQDDPAGRAKLLHHTLALTRETTAGLLAIYELGDRHTPSAEGRALSKAISAWPSQLTTPSPEPNKWARLRIQSDHQTYRYLDPIVATLELYNPTSMDLSLGSVATLPSRVFIYTSISKSGTNLPQFPPIVVDMGRTINLAPRQTVTVDVRLDRTELGVLLSSNPFDTLTIGATAILDPRPNTSTGKPTPGMLGATASMSIIRRQGESLHQNNLKLWMQELIDEQRGTSVLSLARLIKALPAMVTGGPEIADLTDQIADTVNEHYLRADTHARALAIVLIDPVRRVKSLLEPIYDSATRSDDPLIRIMYLATQIQDPQSPDLTAGLRHGDPTVVEFAKALQSGLLIEQQDATPEKSDSTTSGTP